MLGKEAKAAGAEALMTTAKDAVKLEKLDFELPLRIAEIEIQIDDSEGFAALL